MFLRRLLIFLMLSRSIFNCLSVSLDCGELSDPICPTCDHNVTLQCTSDNIPFLVWTANSDDVADFTATDKSNSKECQYGNDGNSVICARLVTINGSSYTSDLTFKPLPSLVEDETVISCDSIDSKSCTVSYLSDPPSPPSTLSFNINDTQLLLMWSDHNKSYSHLSYEISIAPSSPSSNFSSMNYSATTNNLVLNTTDFKPDTNYTAEIRTVLCNGTLQGSKATTITFSIPAPYASSTTTDTAASTSSITPSTSSTTTATYASNSMNSTRTTSTGTTPSSTTLTTTSTGTTDTLIATTTTEISEISTDMSSSTDNSGHHSSHFIVGFGIGSVLVLFFMTIIITVFACTVVMIVRKLRPAATAATQSQSLEAGTRDTCRCTDIALPSPKPPPLPPRIHAASYANLQFELKAIGGRNSPLYDCPQQIYNGSASICTTDDIPRPTTEYSFPIVARFLVSSGNSETTIV